MSNYEQQYNRYTAIFLKAADGTFSRLPFDIVRFNIDVDRQPKRELVPRGSDDGKIFERIWVVKEVPWSKKVSFGSVS
jgi:hypothetical protein